MSILGNRYISQFLSNLSNKVKEGQAIHNEIIKYPTCLKGFNKLIWGTILQGNLDEARKLTQLT